LMVTVGGSEADASRSEAAARPQYADRIGEGVEVGLINSRMRPGELHREARCGGKAGIVVQDVLLVLQPRSGVLVLRWSRTVT
jgi:hypothetical protein